MSTAATDAPPPTAWLRLPADADAAAIHAACGLDDAPASSAWAVVVRHEASAACALLLEPRARLLLPVSRRDEGAAAAADPCACATPERCTSGDVSVRPRCACDDFGGTSAPYCYALGALACPEAAASVMWPGAAYRDCTAPPPPPASPLACTGDPLFAQQWHLARIRAPQAWDRGGAAEGALVVVVDDGVQYAHPDLRVDAARSFGWDAAGARLDTADSAAAVHGTACAGVVAARAHNGRGGCGVAWNATLAAVRLLQSAADEQAAAAAAAAAAAQGGGGGGGSGSNATAAGHGERGEEPRSVLADDLMAATLRAFADEPAAVLSNSWGPPDDGRVDGPGRRQWYARVDAALHEAATAGRGGRGMVLVFAAGNGGPRDNANDDGFAAHEATIAVGAVGDDGGRVVYSERGACLDLVAPSSGGWRDLHTADLVGPAGYGAGDASDAFGGTSAAAPMVAGVAAMLLARRPELSARDVRQILARSAARTHPLDPAWTVNAAGRAFSPWYGFGLLDAAAAVELAASWTPLPARAQAWSRQWRGSRAPLAHSWTTVATFDLPALVNGTVEDAAVHVEAEHPWRGDLLLRLVSPHGTASQLTFEVPELEEGADAPGLHDARFVAHEFLTHAFCDEVAVGAAPWRLQARDLSYRGRVRGARLRLGGALELRVPEETPPSPPAEAGYGDDDPSRTGAHPMLLAGALLATGGAAALVAYVAWRALRGGPGATRGPRA